MSNDFSEELLKTSAKLKYCNDQILNPEYAELLGSDLQKEYLYSTNSTMAVLHYGINSAIKNLIFEGSYIGLATGDALEIVSIYLQFYHDIQVLGDVNEQFFQQAISYSKSIVNQLLNDYIIFSIFYSIILLILYFCYYFPFFNAEKNKILWIQEVSDVLISKKK